MKKIRLFGGSMKSNLLSAFLILGVFLTVSVSFIGYRTFERTLISEIGNNRLDVLSQVADRVKQVKYNAYTLSNLYYYDHTLQEYLKELNREDTPGHRLNLNRYLNRLTNQFKSSFHEDSMKFAAVLALENGGGFSSEKVAADYDYMSPQTKIWYKRMLQASGGIIDIANIRDRDSGQDYFSAARTMLDEAGEPLGYLMINVEEQQLHAMYENVTRGSQNTLYIVDEEGTVVSCSAKNLVGFNLFNMKNLDNLFQDAGYVFTRMRGEQILFTRYQEQDSGFTVMEEIPLSVLMKPIRRVRSTILLIAVLALGLAYGYARHFARRTTRPISELCDFLIHVEEDNLDQPCEVTGYTEINILRNRLNHMLTRMKSLMQGIKQKEQQKRKMELSFLQAQINPHFMYNTLFSIKCMVDMEKNAEASRMLASFIQLLRSTLSNPNEFVTIHQEFEILKQYVEIQKFRYDDGFQVLFECDEAVEQNKIPKLLIQPLLENAIFHGVEFKKSEGLIIITARKLDRDICVTVEDNGMGIAPDIIEKIHRGEHISEKAHVGILNVKERIQLNFGENYGMKIESRQWEGTKIILTFPAVD
ncbi:MAG: sensor histidine kinase [Lachnospiraceae bacterium]|nr:sensor histidine kinase [Lachnospiraceae bacterium]